MIKEQPGHRKLRVEDAGGSDSLGAGDSYLVLDLLGKDSELSNVAFDKVKEEVQWDTMHHRGGEVPRLVAVQGQPDSDQNIPIYRHPSDESPPLRKFTPTIERIRQEVEKVVGHPVNHALIQLYRSGKDYISEHSDKTIDVVRGSTIVNVSLGAQRVMTLRTKKDSVDPTGDGRRKTQRFPLPHNSMFVMGLETNQRWLHAINHDNRPNSVKSEEELAYEGERISLTFRHIGTFLVEPGESAGPDSNGAMLIYGQGATGKSRGEARQVISGDTPESNKLLEAFGKENHDSNFVWEDWYGEGSDVLHFRIQT
ncbi:hypothetical protein GYMLUDRAFT_74874 [Collybiopsis luxurians FD-317 M1]|uniref:Fe2OG dioxygenase domain-containing protein n=1 Tax=Collybiopsis luxurians FD-317 M1 TaxID=944289 RepID=A0A0D0BTA8_9AGAR|nr:hypothetical protein GYMLUDRAFT_74874 [Collybiopsis luxurians FD-317 M1]